MKQTGRKILVWLVVVIMILVGAWFLSTLLQLVSNQKASERERVELKDQVTSLSASRDKLQTAVDELNKRCRDAKDCIPINIADLHGAPGATGATGASGPAGPAGSNGQNGTDGKNGKDGVNGLNGVDGQPGPAGPQGLKGDKGDTGSSGTDGTSAVPFTFTFTIPGNGNSGDTTYTCTVNQPSTNITCQVV